ETASRETARRRSSHRAPGLPAEARSAKVGPQLANREEHALRRQRAVEDDEAVSEGGDRITNRLAHRNREHQRRLTHRFAPEDDVRLAGVPQELDSEIRGHFGPRGQLVRRRAGGGEATVVVPQQLFEREPAHALDEAAFDLAAIDDGRYGIADVLEDVHAPQ